MPRIYYESFDIVITRMGDKTYKATVPGVDFVEFTLAKAPDEVVKAVTRHFSIAGGTPAAESDTTGGASTGGEAQDVGSYLFQSIFQSKMLAIQKLAQERARQRNSYLRLRLNLTDVPELVGLPWEMMRNEINSLSLAPQTSVVRYQNVPFPKDDQEVKDKPLRMLVVISNPQAPGAPALKVEEEWERINKALQPFSEQGLIELDRLPRATLKQLDDRLFDLNRPVHIFHYIGHGAFNAGKGQLLFELEPDDDAPASGTMAGGFDLVDGQRLADSLYSHEALRFAVLNSCEGAMVSSEDSYAGVAQHLLRTGNVPVVVAMRKAVSDQLAITFAQTFYEWLLVKNLSVDAAMTRARLRMRDVEQKRDATRAATEWATPILFMRNHSGYFVNFGDVAQAIVPDKLPDEIDPATITHYQTVLNALTQAKLVPFLGLDVNLFGRAAIKNWRPDSLALPGYRELVEYLATISNHPYPFVPALADVSQYALLQYMKDENKGEGTFYTDLISIFMQTAEPTALHQFWARIAAHNEQLTRTAQAPTETAQAPTEDVKRRFLIVSSTYDNLLEKAFIKELDRFHVVSYIAHGDYKGKFRHTVYAKAAAGAAEPVPQAPAIVESGTNYGGLFDQAPVILKIPGTVGDIAGPRFAITEDQFLDFLGKNEVATIIPAQLLSKLRNANYLFLGYNVREWCLRALLYRIWNDQKPPLASWSVQEQPTEVEKSYWEACKVRIIERALTDYLDGLRRSCEALLPGVQL